MAKNRANDAAKKKAAKEKRILIILVVLLLPALGYAYKTMTKLHSSAEPTDGPVVVATTTSSTTSSTPPAASSTQSPASSSSSSPASTPVDVATGTSSTSGGAGASGGSSGLVSAVVPALGQGQLRTFTLLDTKDPFFSGGPSTSATPGTGAGLSSGSTGSTSPPPQPSRPKPRAAQSPKPAKIVLPAPTSAVISVNGAKGLVTVSSDFPVSSDPTMNDLFRLAGLTRTTAKIAIVGGSYASGAATLTLHVGQPVTLANTADGTRYTLELFRQGTPVPTQSAPSANTSTTPSTTTPTSTTPTS